MAEAAVPIYSAASIIIGMKAEVVTLEKFIPGDRLGVRAMVKNSLPLLSDTGLADGHCQ